MKNMKSNDSVLVHHGTSRPLSSKISRSSQEARGPYRKNDTQNDGDPSEGSRMSQTESSLADLNDSHSCISTSFLDTPTSRASTISEPSTPSSTFFAHKLFQTPSKTKAQDPVTGPTLAWCQLACYPCRLSTNILYRNPNKHSAVESPVLEPWDKSVGFTMRLRVHLNFPRFADR